MIKINRNNRGIIKTIIIYSITFICIFAIIISAVSPKKYDLNVGDIAKNDIKATRDIIDEEASEEKLNQALEKVDKQYTVKGEVKKQAKENIDNLFLNLSGSTINSDGESVNRLNELIVSKIITEAQAKVLKEYSDGELETIKNQLNSIIDKVYETNISDSDSKSLDLARTNAEDLLSNSDIDKDLIDILLPILKNEIQPNTFYDSEKTEEMKAEVTKNTEKVVIKKDQIIVKEGEPVTESQIKILKSLGILNEGSGNGMTLIYIVLTVFLLSILYLQYWYIHKYFKSLANSHKKILMLNLISVISIALARVAVFISPFIIPLAFGTILTAILINSRVSLFINSMNILLISTVVEFNPRIIILSIVYNIIGSILLQKTQQRNDILRVTLYLAVIGALFNFSIGVILSSNIPEILINTAYVIFGVFLSGVFSIGLLPVFESIFDVVTAMKLLELSNPNNPLLKRLLMEAPGTYHHSMLVANLVEMAADKVGADSVVARIGAYYHDVGKINRPYFFKENQLTKENPHDGLDPTLSTKIILSHVKDGIELAKEYNLPKIIQDIIQQHHGKTLVKYFYYTVKNNSEDPASVKESDFMYLGPIPNTKEAAIIMLADSTEAAVRSIDDTSVEKIEKMVNTIIDDKLQSGQLDNCDLTLKDIKIIKNCFMKALNGIYHKRIEYPSEKK